MKMWMWGSTFVNVKAGDMEYTPLPSAHLRLAALLLSCSRALALGRCWPGPPHSLQELTPSPQSGHAPLARIAQSLVARRQSSSLPPSHTECQCQCLFRLTDTLTRDRVSAW